MRSAIAIQNYGFIPAEELMSNGSTIGYSELWKSTAAKTQLCI